MNHISLAVDQLTVDLAPTKTITAKAGTLMAIGERAGQAELDALAARMAVINLTAGSELHRTFTGNLHFPEKHRGNNTHERTPWEKP